MEHQDDLYEKHGKILTDDEVDALLPKYDFNKEIAKPSRPATVMAYNDGHVYARLQTGQLFRITKKNIPKKERAKLRRKLAKQILEQLTHE